MRWKEINEAPLADFGAYGDLDKEGSFRNDDLRAIRNPKWLEKVRSGLSRSNYLYNIYLMNGEDGYVTFDENGVEGYSRVNVRDLSTLNRWAGMYPIGKLKLVTGRDPPSNYYDCINLLLTENEGAERMPLTPWMLAHRMAHSILYAGTERVANKDQELSVKVNEFYRLMTNFVGGVSNALLNSAYHGDDIRAAKELDKPDSTISNQIKVFAPLIAKFRSGEKANFASSGEFYVELMTQYVIQGKISFKRPNLDDRGAGKPWEEITSKRDNALLDMARARAASLKDADGEEFADAVGESSPTPPQASWIGLDANGKPTAQFSASFDPEGPRGQEYAAKGMTFKHRPVSPAMERGYAKSMQNWQKERDRIAALWQSWAASGRLDRDADWRTSTDRLDAYLTENEKKMNELLHAMLVRCKGKLLIL